MTRDKLRTAAQAVIDRWETPLWKDAPATAEYIAALRDALAAERAAAGQEPVAAPMDGEIALIEKALERVGISSLLNHGAASCVFTEGCCGVSQEHILAYTREIAMHCAVALGAAPQPAVAAGWPLIARALDEWHEDDGPVMWWAWNGSTSGWAGEPAWCGTPLSSDWPGYHTHWTPHPTFPPAPSTEGESNG